MIHIVRDPQNPILAPNPENAWESTSVFNPSPFTRAGKNGILYRALGPKELHYGVEVEISTIGCAQEEAPGVFTNRKQFITPQQPWERFGCEDPRVTEFEGSYYTFYTALSEYPFHAGCIKVAVAVSKDMKTVKERHLVTPFNAKAMALFPKRINGKIAAVLTVHTDLPPAKIAIALFDRIEDMWSVDYWQRWYANLDDHVVNLQRRPEDHIEVGAPPIKTKDGWLLLYSYIRDYMSPMKTFGIEAGLLLSSDPRELIGRTLEPMMIPEEKYEREGMIPNIVFPSGAALKKGVVTLYYGAADSSCARATFPLEDFMTRACDKNSCKAKLRRSDYNPILEPTSAHVWESKAVFNPGVIYEDKKFHIFYRAMSEANTSVLGYASSRDGMHIDQRLPDPVYVPRETFEQKAWPGNSGCEDPRLTRIGTRVYMLYTAFDGKMPPRVALTHISKKDLVEHRWNFSKPILISAPNTMNKDAALFPKKIGGKYYLIHRIEPDIWIDAREELDFSDRTWLGGTSLMGPRPDAWDSLKVGLSAPPVETKEGWLLIYHGVSKTSMRYRVGAALLDLNNPQKVLARSADPIFVPERTYELVGQVPNVVFPCGVVVRGRTLYIYYGAADTVIGLATVPLNDLLSSLIPQR